MGSVNKAILVGNLGRDAEMRFTAGGTPVATVSLATTERFNDREGQRKEETEWHRVVIWGKTAESIHEYLTKGKQIYVEGRIQTREWTDKDGKQARTTEIRADRIVLLGGGGGGGTGGGNRASRDRYDSAGDQGAPADLGPVDAPSDDDIPF
jgi:single-strand DNA-binding protein